MEYDKVPSSTHYSAVLPSQPDARHRICAAALVRTLDCSAVQWLRGYIREWVIGDLPDRLRVRALEGGRPLKKAEPRGYSRHCGAAHLRVLSGTVHLRAGTVCLFVCLPAAAAGGAFDDSDDSEAPSSADGSACAFIYIYCAAALPHEWHCTACLRSLRRCLACDGFAVRSGVVLLMIRLAAVGAARVGLCARPAGLGRVRLGHAGRHRQRSAR